MPAPNVMCGFGSRSRSQRVRVGRRPRDRGWPSRTAAPTSAPRGHAHAVDLDVLEHPALEHLQRRVVAHQLLDRGGHQRRARRAARSSAPGLRNSAHQPLPVTFTVASWPALSSSTQVPISSSSVSRSPSSTTSASALIRSPVGVARRSRDKRAQVVGELDARGHGDRGVFLGRVQLVHAADVGRPGPQQVPVGLGARRAARRSPPPAAARRSPASRSTPPPATASTSPSASSCTGVRIDSTMRGVNAFDTSRRSRVWSGGSMSSMPCVDQMPERVERRRGGSWPNSSCVADVQIRAAEPAVAQQRVHVVVAGHEPLVGGLVVEDRRRRTQALVRRVGVGDEPDVVGIEPERPRIGSLHVATVAFRACRRRVDVSVRWPSSRS